MKKLTIGVAATIVFGILCVAASATYHQFKSHQDRKEFPAPGQLVMVEGKGIHVDCRGSGSPTVVLEAGLTADVLSWGLVHDQMAEITRVCSYDRPGLGWSEPHDSESSSAEIAERLQVILDTVGVNKPIVLLGMSAGGVYAREFQRQFPDRVVGMVFVDSSHEQQGTRLPEFEEQSNVLEQIKQCEIFARFGVIRLMGIFDDLMETLNVPETLQPGMIANMNQTHTCTTLRQEMEVFPKDIEQPTGPTSLGDLPIVVLTQGKPLDVADYPEGIKRELLEELRRTWLELQTELVNLSTDSQHVIAEKSGHVIQFDQPELVIKAVKDIVGKVRG